MKQGVILIGEPMGLLIAQEEGPLDSVSGFSLAVAGAEFNVAVGLSRLGNKAAYMTKLGHDPFGQRIFRAIEGNQIGTELVSWSDTRPTGFMMKGRVSKGDPSIFYFRKGSAASTLSVEDVECLPFDDYGFLHLTGILPPLSDSTREASFYLMDKAREHGLTISFDPNLRPQLWPDQETMAQVINALAARADYVFPGTAEGKLLMGSSDPEEINRFYLELGVKTVITKCGSKGAYVSTPEGSFWSEGFRVEKVVDTVGAGDGFAAGTIHGILEDLSLPEAVRIGNAVGAMQVMNRGDNEGLPTPEQLQAFLDTHTH